MAKWKPGTRRARVVHRMGESEVFIKVLPDTPQTALHSPPCGPELLSDEEAEYEMLFKLHIYNSVNGLYRFVFVLMILLPVTLLCLITSTGSTTWSYTQCGGSSRERGIFVACAERWTSSCPALQVTVSQSSFASKGVWLTDALTDGSACQTSDTSAKNYAAAMFACGAAQLVCNALMIFWTWRLFLRATRLRSMLALLVTNIISASLGISDAVLFSFSSSCERQQRRDAKGARCASGYGWGYRLYLGALSMQIFLLLVNALFIRFFHELRTHARQVLQEDRRRRWLQAWLKQVEVRYSPPAHDEDGASTIHNSNIVFDTRLRGDEGGGVEEGWKPLADFLQEAGGGSVAWDLTVTRSSDAISHSLVVQLRRGAPPSAAVAESAGSTVNTRQAPPHPLPYLSSTGTSYSLAVPGSTPLAVDTVEADDWIYDVKADLLYSAKCNLYWDQGEDVYYNRHLQVWQRSPYRMFLP